MTIQAKTAFHSLKEAADYFAANRDFHLNTLVTFSVHKGVGLAISVVEVLGHVLSALMAFGAEGPPSLVYLVGVGTF